MITQNLMKQVFLLDWHEEIVLENQSVELMYEIHKTMSFLAPIDKDGTRFFWLEIPDKYATHWYHVSTRQKDDYINIKVTDKNNNICIMSNKNRGNGHIENVEWFLKPFLDMVKKKINEILSNPDEYNDYINKNLPYRQRRGRISRREFNRIFPHFKVETSNNTHAVEVIKRLIAAEIYYKNIDIEEQNNCNKNFNNNIDDKTFDITNNYYRYIPSPFNSMDIKVFCKYYRFADEFFRHQCHDKNIDDLEYYMKYQNDYLDNCIFDEGYDFTKYATTNYGELGRSRIHLTASDKLSKGKWVIELDICHSPYIIEGLNVMMFLYDNCVPLVLRDAEKLLAILEERDYILLSLLPYHEKKQNHIESTIYSLPDIKEIEEENEVTKEQYNEVIRLAEWEPEVKVLGIKHCGSTT